MKVQKPIRTILLFSNISYFIDAINICGDITQLKSPNLKFELSDNERHVFQILCFLVIQLILHKHDSLVGRYCLQLEYITDCWEEGGVAQIADI